MKTPRNRTSTLVSRMISRQIPEYSTLLRTNAKHLAIKCFFDYFAVLTNSIDEDFLKRNCRELQYKGSKCGYRQARRYTSSLGSFVIFEDCVRPTYWFYKIQLHEARKFKSLGDIELSLASIMGYIDERNHVLNRVDLGFAVHESIINPGIMLMSSHLKWKGSTSNYNNIRHDYKNGQLTGVHSNGGSLRQSYYVENGKSPGKIKQEYVDEMKVESQVMRKAFESKAIYSIYDLPLIKRTNLLDRFAFYNLLWIEKEKANNVNLRKFRRLQEKAILLGFHHARKFLNPHDNFDRDYKAMLLPLCVGAKEIPLNLIFKRKFLKWLKRFSKGISKPLHSEMSWATTRPVIYLPKRKGK